MEVALDLALQCSPRPPVGRRAPRVVHDAAPTARSPTPRTRRRSTRTSTRSTSTTTPRASTPRCCASSGTGSTTGCAIFRVDNPHTKPVELLGVADRARSSRTDPDVLFLAEAFTRPAMMHALAKVGFQQSYTYFTWRNRKPELSEYVDASSVDAAALHAAELLREHAATSCTRTCSTAGRRRSRSAPCSRRMLVADLGRLRGLRALRARRRAPGQRGVPRLREVPVPPARLGGSSPGAARAVARAVPHPAQRDPPRAPGPAAAARHLRSTTSTTTTSSASRSATTGRRR